METNNNNGINDFELLQNFIRQGDTSTLKQQLLKSAFDVECKDDIGNTPLLQAAYLGKTDCVEILLEVGQANCQVINVFGQNALSLASYGGNIDCIKVLLTKWTYKNYTESSLLPPLCVAAMKGHLDIVNLFCQLSPSPNLIQSIHGVTPLDLAKKNGHNDVVQLLFKELSMKPTEQNGKQKRRSFPNRGKPY